MKTTWDLQKYFYKNFQDPHFTQDLEKIMPEIQKFFEEYSGKIQEFSDEKNLEEYFKTEEELERNISKPFLYTHYQYALDTQNPEVQKKLEELKIISIEVQKKLIPLQEEWKKLGTEKLLSFSQKSSLAPYKNALKRKANSIQYMLEEKEEKLLNNFGRFFSVIDSIEEELRGSYEFPITIEGKRMKKNEEEIRTLSRNTDREIRKKASKSIESVYGNTQNQITLSHVYLGVVKRSVASLESRGYKHVMSKRNLSEQMSDKTIETLLKQTKKYASIGQRFFQKKKELLGYKDFYGYDLYTPMGKEKKKYTYEESMELYLSIMKDFHPFFHDYGKNMAKEGRIDVLPKKGKRSGAFASYDKNQPSFVLLNHSNTLHDVFTLFHELGHATHGALSQKQPEAVYSSGLCLAETASIFNELLLTDFLLTQDIDKKELLNMRLMDIFGTIFRQVQYVSFEKEIHEGIYSGKSYTYKDLNTLWRKNQDIFLGKTVKYTKPAEKTYGWSMIPHIFHSPFYCYSYAFGMILSLTLFNKYKENKQEFLKTYINILESGWSLSPEDLLKNHDIDITKEKFYTSAFITIDNLVKEFEKLN